MLTVFLYPKNHNFFLLYNEYKFLDDKLQLDCQIIVFSSPDDKSHLDWQFISFCCLDKTFNKQLLLFTGYKYIYLFKQKTFLLIFMTLKCYNKLQYLYPFKLSKRVFSTEQDTFIFIYSVLKLRGDAGSSLHFYKYSSVPL